MRVRNMQSSMGVIGIAVSADTFHFSALKTFKIFRLAALKYMINFYQPAAYFHC